MKISKKEEFREGCSGCVVEWGSETIAQQDGTTNLFRHVFSANVKMVSEKYWLHMYWLACSVFWLALHCRVVSLHAPGPYVRMKLENTEIKLSCTPFVTQIMNCV
jgi:hypothetical protein